VPRPRRSQRGFPVPAREILPGLLSRMQDALLAGQGPARNRGPCSLWNSGPWLPYRKLAASPPLRAARSLNSAVLTVSREMCADSRCTMEQGSFCSPIATWISNASPLLPAKFGPNIWFAALMRRRPLAADGICGRHTSCRMCKLRRLKDLWCG
jgi:hypothetical protein